MPGLKSTKPTVAGTTCLIFWLLSTTILFGYIWNFGSPLPYADDWGNVPQALGESPITWHWLWSLHNEHRIPLHRLVYVGLVNISGNDFRAGMFFNLVVLSSLALILLIQIARIRGKSIFTDIFIPACLVSFAQYENLLWSNQIQFLLTFLFLVTILTLIAGKNGSSEFKRLIGIASCLILLPLCGLPGLIAQIAILLWFAAWVLIRAKLEKLSGRQTISLGLLIALAASVTLFYFVDYHPVFFFRSFFPVDVIRGSIQFLSTSFGPSGIETGVFGGAICLLLVAMTFALLIFRWKADPANRFRLSGLIALILSMLLMTLSVGIGRSGGGQSGAAHRYAIFTAFLLLVIYFTFSLFSPKGYGKFVPAFLLIIVLISIPENARVALNYGNSRRDSYLAFVEDLQSNLPVEVLALRDLDAMFPFYGPFIPENLRLLEKYKVGPFADRELPLPQLFAAPKEINIMPANMPASKLTNRFVLALDKPDYILGFRTSFIIENDRKQPQMFLAWQSESGQRIIRYPLASSRSEQTASFWIYDSVKQIELVAPQDRLRVSKMILLLPR